MPTRLGLWTSPKCVGTRGGWLRRPAGRLRSPWSGPWPTSWPSGSTGAVGLPTRRRAPPRALPRVHAAGGRGSGADPDAAPDLVLGLLGQAAGRAHQALGLGGQTLLDAVQAALDLVPDGLHGAVEALDQPGDLPTGLLELSFDLLALLAQLL